MGADEPQEIRRAVSGAAAVAIRDIVSKNPVAAGHFDGREATEVVARGDVTIVYFGDEWTSATMPRWIEGVPQKVPSGLSSPEARSAAASDGRRALDLLLEQLDGDEHGQSILLLECDGVDEPKEQAAQLNVALPIVYKARYRLSRAREAVKQRLQGEVRHA